jgi:hypothetical protein
VRFVIAYAEHIDKPICVLSIDFSQAFDKISHQYLFEILSRYGITSWFAERLRAMYEGAEATVQINGSMVGKIPIQCGVRQGCPLSTTMYALCAHPLLQTLHESLPKIRIGRHSLHCPVFANADDVRIFVTCPEDLEVIKATIATYLRASGAAMNPRKSRALPLGRWATPPTTLGIAVNDQIRILGVEFTNTIKRSAMLSWDRVISAVRAQACTTYSRQLDFAQRIQFFTHYLLAKLWYVAQMFPARRQHAQRITTACTWYLWKGSVFRVPALTLQLTKNKGGWALPNIESKCRTVLYNRLKQQQQKEAAVTAALMRLLRVSVAQTNPPPEHQRHTHALHPSSEIRL